MNGKLTIALELAGMGADGFQMVSHITIEGQGKTYDVQLSRWETDYIGVDKSGVGSGWNIVLRPGGVYHIKGEEQDGEIEATLLSLEVAPTGEDAMVQPLANWLPSTWSLMEEHTWLGKLSGK